MSIRPSRIVSGGQTGADRGALEASVQLDIPHGGWCPRGRKAEDGLIPPDFDMRETPSAAYEVRTRWNVRDSDATVILTLGPPTGGSALTARIARELGRPLLLVDLAAMSVSEAADELIRWLNAHRPPTLNVAGSRESGAPGIRASTKKVLLLALGRS